MDERDLDDCKMMIRALRKSVARVLDGQVQRGKRVDIPSDAGSAVVAWLHTAPSARRPLVIELHGGGFALGDARKNDAFREEIANAWDVNMLGVGYRLAPEHPFPAALEDVILAVRWCRDHGEELGIDATRIYALGYSAGANLAVASALYLGAEEPQPYAGLMLHYPVFDSASDPSEKPHRDIDLSVPMMKAFSTFYADGADARNPLISPVFAGKDQLALLPDICLYPVVGDLLFDEAKRFSNAVNQAGVTCSFHPVEGAYHGYIEDAANDEAYRATALPETIDARPSDYRERAREMVRASLSEFL